MASLSLFASICSAFLSSLLLPVPSSSLCVSSSCVLFPLLFLSTQPCSCRSHNQRQSPISELSTKKLPFKNSHLEVTCILSSPPPFLAIYRTRHPTEHSTACCLHDPSHKNEVKMTVYPLCVRIGRDPSFQEICALQDHWEAELLKCVPTMGDAPLVSSRCLSYFFCQFFFFFIIWMMSYHYWGTSGWSLKCVWIWWTFKKSSGIREMSAAEAKRQDELRWLISSSQIQGNISGKWVHMANRVNAHNTAIEKKEIFSIAVITRLNRTSAYFKYGFESPLFCPSTCQFQRSI